MPMPMLYFFLPIFQTHLSLLNLDYVASGSLPLSVILIPNSLCVLDHRTR